VNKTSPNAALILLVLGTASPRTVDAAALEQPHIAPPLNVRIFNYAAVSDGAFEKAQKEAARIFRLAGVETRWIECGPTASDPGCASKTTAMDIVLRTIPEELTNVERHSEFGVAFVPMDGRFGKHASVYFTRVEEYAERWQSSAGPLLGHLIAHEIGHLLLGANSHSQSGIMNVPWTREKIDRARSGTLAFTKPEAKKMRRQVAARVELALDPGDR
jgi:hypothetical protein